MGRNITEPISRDAPSKPTGSTPRSPAAGKTAQQRDVGQQQGRALGTPSPKTRAARPGSANVAGAKSAKYVDPMAMPSGGARTPVGSQLAPTRRASKRGTASANNRGESLTQRTVRLANEFANVHGRDSDLPEVEEYAPAGFKPQLDEDPAVMHMQQLRSKPHHASSAASTSKLSTMTQPSTSSGGVKPYTRTRSPKLAAGGEQRQQHLHAAQPQRRVTTLTQDRSTAEAPQHRGSESTGQALKLKAKEAVHGHEVASAPAPAYQRDVAGSKGATKPATLRHFEEHDDARVQGQKKEPVGHKLKRKAKEFVHAVAHPGGHRKDEHHEASMSDSMPAPRDAHDAPKPQPVPANAAVSPSYQRPTAASSGRVAFAAEERKWREQHQIQQRKEGISG